ncbi:Dynein light chain-related protein [Niveomyces insectorum RCEF 264]|uniref:Dynein light chain-related protein n=1 Tax=Niveomyces insectorum RCEF 264 TaxID=1081102 RepID=A0A167URN0_9HYPO|nr:Dynein light chain-related protein [Niveomyces insectorum RCEF 264]
MSADFSIGGSNSDVLDETLGRLAKKAGVHATILLDRSSGAILRMEGQIASIRTAVGSSSSNGSGGNGKGNSNKNGTANSGTSTQTGAGLSGGEAPGADNSDGLPADETKGARELAGLVWNFVKTSGDLVEAIDTDDELKLLRLRTKKQELVIVPDPKYLLIVVHDTPPA